MLFLLNGKPVDALALVVHKTEQDDVARRWVKKLRKSLSRILGSLSMMASDAIIPRQLFEVPIQAAIGKKVIARETLKALRRDVTAGLYGGCNNLADLINLLNDHRTGHYERKMKHLENQKESKKRMRKLGKVELSQDAFFKILSKE